MTNNPVQPITYNGKDHLYTDIVCSRHAIAQSFNSSNNPQLVRRRFYAASTGKPYLQGWRPKPVASRQGFEGASATNYEPIGQYEHESLSPYEPMFSPDSSLDGLAQAHLLEDPLASSHGALSSIYLDTTDGSIVFCPSAGTIPLD